MKQDVCEPENRDKSQPTPGAEVSECLMSTSSPSLLSSDYVFVTPVEVDSEGAYLTHDVTRQGRRSRRSLSSSRHYWISAFGQDMHLDLHPSSVVGPGFTVQTLGSDGVATSMADEAFHNCLYHGFIRNLSASSAAISTCSGLVSVCQ